MFYTNFRLQKLFLEVLYKVGNFGVINICTVKLENTIMDVVDGPKSLLYPGEPKWGTRFSGNTITYNFMPSIPEIYLPGNLIEAISIDSGPLRNIDSFQPFDIRQQAAAEETLGLWASVANINFERREDTVLRLADIVNFGQLEDVLNFLGLYDDFARALDDRIGNLIGFPIISGADIRFGTDDQDESAGRAFRPPDNLQGRFDELRRDIADFIDRYLGPFLDTIERYNNIPLLPNIPIPTGAEVLKLASIKLDADGDVWLDNSERPANEPDRIGFKGAFGFHTLIHEVGHALGLKHPGNYNAGGGGAPGPYLPEDKDNKKYSVMSYNRFRGHGGVVPETPMLYDISAIQMLYGANNNTRTGDDTYFWDRPFVATIWDTGGTDTISAANQTLDAVINLNAGNFSSIGPTGATEQSTGEIVADTSVRMIDNLAIAFNVVIENAIGGSGNDTLVGNASKNTLDGRNGLDTASYENSDAGVVVNLAEGNAIGGHAEGDTLQSIENLEGSAFGDSLTGNTSSNILEGLGGNDFIDGGTGSNSDTVSYAKSPNGVTVMLDIVTAEDGFGTIDTLIGIENIIASQLDDVLTGNELDNKIEGLDGNDLFTGNFGRDTFDGGNGDDTVDYSLNYPMGVNVNLETGIAINLNSSDDTDTLRNIENIIASQLDDDLTGNKLDNKIEGFAGNDKVSGGDGNDYLYGGSGNDRVSGGNGKDDLYGGSGNDEIYGNNGNDYLVGGLATRGQSGRDTLTGGSGADDFSFVELSSQEYLSKHYLGGGYAVITDFNPGEKDEILLAASNPSYTLSTGNWGGTTAQDTEIYFQRDLIARVYDHVIDFDSDVRFMGPET